MRRWIGSCAIGLAALLAGACYEGEPPGQAGAQAQASRIGELCTSSKDCAEEEFCDVGGEGMCGREGTCQLRPLECTRDVAVCGCDGQTYWGGACEASMNGEGVDFEGACPPPGCLDNSACGTGEYCAKMTGDCGGYGACTLRPFACSNAYNPVCGCNGVTYGNACKAAKAGVSIVKNSKC